MELFGMAIVEAAKIAKRDRAKCLVTMLGKPGEVTGGKGATVGDDEQAVGQGQMLAQQLEMFMNGGVAILVTTDDVGENRNGAELVDHGGGADLDHFLVLDVVAIGDVGGVDQRGWPDG